MPDNHGAYLVDNKGKPLEVRPAPYTAPGPNELVIKNSAIAVNPVDYGKQLVGDNMFNWVKYPFILGSDIAGEVVEVGNEVTHLKAGDRVLAFAVGFDKRSNRSCEGAFQEYTVVRKDLATPIPSGISFSRASVLPLAVGTAGCGLFMQGLLALNTRA